MNVLIINPPDFNTIPEFSLDGEKGYLEADDYGYFPPLGALYVLSYAEKNLPQHTYHFIDAIGEKLTYENLELKISQIKPDIVGITSFTVSLIDVVLTAKIVKKLFPQCHTCLGGHHPTAFAHEAAQIEEFDSIVVGEGEYAFTELIKALCNNEEITNIKGIYTKKSFEENEISEFKDRRFLAHLKVEPGYVDEVDDIPSPNRKYIQNINYNSIVGLTGKLATIITTRGCPYKCTFCDVPYKKYRQRDIELVMDEIQECIDLGYEEFHFYDDLFNINAQKILLFCEAISKRGFTITWDFRGRVNGVTFESLKAAKDVGLRMISFGIETGSDMGLKTLKKGSSIQQVMDTFKWCEQLGIKTIANYMIGLPHEKSRQDILNNIDFLIKLNPNYAQINILSLYPHTEVYNQAVDKGIARKGEWEKFALDPLNYKFKVEHWTEFVTEEELLRLQRYSYRKFYFRPSYILKSIKDTTTLHELKSKSMGVLKILGF